MTAATTTDSAVAAAPSPTSTLARGPAWFAVGAETVAAAVVTAWTLGTRSFWLDEAATARFLSHSFPGTVRVAFRDEPLNASYYVVLRVWSAPFGTGEVALRSFSVVVAAACVPVVYVLAVKLFDRTTGVVAGLLTAVSATVVAQGQNARGYALAMLLVAVATIFLVRAVERGTQASWLLYALVATAAVYVHFLVVAVLVAHAVSLLFLRRAQVPWRAVLIAAATIGIALVPLAVLVLRQGPEKLDWIQPTSFRGIQVTYEALAGGSRAVLLVALVACAVATAAGVRTWRRSGAGTESWRYGLLLASVTVPTAFLVAVSLAKHLYVPRYLIGMLPAFVILAAVGIVAMRPRWLGITFMVVLIALNLNVMQRWLRTDSATAHTAVAREDWRGVVDYVRARARPADVVLLQPRYTETPWDYYAARAAARPTPRLAALDGAYRDYVDGGEVRRLADGHDRIWVVVSQAAREQRHAIRDELAASYRLVGELRFPGEIDVLRYVAR